MVSQSINPSQTCMTDMSKTQAILQYCIVHRDSKPCKKLSLFQLAEASSSSRIFMFTNVKNITSMLANSQIWILVLGKISQWWGKQTPSVKGFSVTQRISMFKHSALRPPPHFHCKYFIIELFNRKYFIYKNTCYLGIFCQTAISSYLELPDSLLPALGFW